MQGQFPIARTPYQHIASQAGIAEAEVLTRIQHLLDERIIRQVTPDLRHACARVLPRCWSPPRSTPTTRGRAANVINEHPGVSHNYLRNHEFNIWFTIATEPDSPLGLEDTLLKLGELAGAESIRQLPTIKLFKIRMDLEMEAGTETLANPVAEAAEPAETERQDYDDFDKAVIRATQGDLPVVSEPYAKAAGRAGNLPGRAARAPGRHAGAQAAAPRCRNPLSSPRRLQRQRHGRFGRSRTRRSWRWACRCPPSAGSRTATQRPTYADWPYSVFTMAHGRSKEECDAILDSISEATGITERSTLYSSTEFKKIRLMYFTDEYRNWEKTNAGI